MLFGRKKQKVTGIKRKTLDMILEVAKDSYPNEFAGVLRAKDGVIHEIMLLPGTFSGERHAIMHLHMLPIDYSVVGTVHSHPSPNFEPSDADLGLFGKFGYMHIIAAWPYNDHSWAAYDLAGTDVLLEII